MVQYPRSYAPQPIMIILIVFVNRYRISFYPRKFVLKLIVVVIYFFLLHTGYYLHKK